MLSFNALDTCDDIVVENILDVSNAVIEVRRRFVGAPVQFNPLIDELRSLSKVLVSLETCIVERTLSNQQLSLLKDHFRTCNELLNHIEKTCDQYCSLKEGGARVSSQKVWKDLDQEPEEIWELPSRMKSSTSLLNALVQDLNHKISRLSLTEASILNSAPALDPVPGQHRLRQHKNDPYHGEIVSWLSTFDYHQQADYIQRVHKETGQWFLTSKDFRRWLSGTHETLFCPGSPGAGKTMLTALIVDYLWKKFRVASDIGIGFLYCSKWQQRSTSESLILDLLKQLVQAQTFLCHDVRIMYQNCIAYSRRPSKFDIAKAIRSVVNEYSRVYIIVDALDEIDAEVRKSFLNDIFLLQKDTGLNILATACKVPEIVAAFSNDKTKSLEVFASDEDIAAYFNDHVIDLPFYVSKDSILRKQIARQIVNNAKGIFLLAVMNIEVLRHKASPEAMKEALSTLPKTLNDAYSELFEMIKNQDERKQELAKKVFFWTICAKRLLTINEILDALTVNLVASPASAYEPINTPTLEQIESACAGLVIMNYKSNTTHLISTSVQEYILNMDMSSLWLVEAQIYITKVCLTYLSLDVFRIQSDTAFATIEEQLEWNSLFGYASEYWGEHALGSTQKFVRSLGMKFFSKPSNLECSVGAVSYIKGYDNSARVRSRATYTHLCAHFDLQDLLEKASSRFKLDVDVEDGHFQTPLFWAARRGNEKITAFLLSLHASQASKRLEDGRTPLHEAARRGHLAVVKLLMSRNDAPVEFKSNDGSTILHEAAGNGHTKIAEFLIEGANVEVNQTNNRNDTPLHRAAARGHLAIVELLVKQKGILINAKNHMSQTPFHLAASCGFEDVTTFLAKQIGIELDSKDLQARTPLIQTALQEHDSIFRFLAAQHNVQIDSKDNYDRTALSYLAQLGNTKLVQFIAEQPGVSIDEKDTTGRTPFSYAAESMSSSYVVESMNPSIARRLVEKNATESRVRTITSEVSTSLTYATERRHLSMVRFLASHVDVQVDSQDRGGRTPLSFAAERGYVSVVEFLMEHDAVQVDSKGLNGRTPLSYAASRGHEAMIGLFAKHDGVEIDSRDIYGRTPLSYAAASGHKAAVELLLSQSSSHIDAGDQAGRTPLSHAAESGDLGLVSLFLDRGNVRVDGKDINGKSPLWWAMRWNNEAVVEYLVGHGAMRIEKLY